jgi:exosortase/archaeosortase family protein
VAFLMNFGMKLKNLMHPSLKFLLKFATSYLVGNLLYLAFLKYQSPDAFTQLSALLLDACSLQINTRLSENAQSFLILYQGKPIVNLAEGCNGVAIWISLMSFCIGYGGRFLQLLILAPISYFLLQISNIFRLYLLVQIKVFEPNHFEFFHEYAFPAILYAFAFLLMVAWVKWQQRHSQLNS